MDFWDPNSDSQSPRKCFSPEPASQPSPLSTYLGLICKHSALRRGQVWAPSVSLLLPPALRLAWFPSFPFSAPALPGLCQPCLCRVVLLLVLICIWLIANHVNYLSVCLPLWQQCILHASHYCRSKDWSWCLPLFWWHVEYTRRSSCIFLYMNSGQWRV